MTNPQSSSDRTQVIYAQVIARTWGDEAYKAQLLANPRQVLTEEGMLLPESATIQVLENTEAVHYVLLPEGRSLADFKDDVVSGLAPLFPLSADQEIIIRQGTEDVKYFVLPRKPELTAVELNAALANIALGNITAANTNVVANAEVVANSVAANNTVAATNVVGAAEVVAVIAVVLI